MKRLEGEVLETLQSLGEVQQALEHTGLTVDPHQFLGMELNPRAAVIADLVLWIGYLQWHFRTRGDAQPPIPVIRNFHNIVEADALLKYDEIVPALSDSDGHPITEWDRVTFTISKITGRKIPDLTSRKPVFAYTDPERREWPPCDFIVGNPPFIGKGEKLLKDLGEGYVKTLRLAYKGLVPDGSDFVMYWWKKAAALVVSGRVRQAGLISTNSISQKFNSRVVAEALSGDSPGHLAFAIPDHPWIDSKDGAAVRIAMTVVASGVGEGLLETVIDEVPNPEESELMDVVLQERRGLIHRNLTVGVNVTAALPLQSNARIASTGLILGSRGFVFSSAEASQFSKARSGRTLLHPLYTGTDVTEGFRGCWVLDASNLSEEAFRAGWPELYQVISDRVKPDRDANRDDKLQDNWWLFRRSNQQVRAAIAGLDRFIVTPETSKHRFFVFLSNEIKPEHGLVVFGSQDAFTLGILSSRIHLTWTAHAGGTLEDRPRYNKTVCFDPFPFPDCSEAHKIVVREIADKLDAHRKRQLRLHPGLTLTSTYNVLEKLRAGEALSEEDRKVYAAGLVGTLQLLHDELNNAVSDAYGWSRVLTTEEVLENIVTLNADRRKEEADGYVRLLRPELQVPNAVPTQAGLNGFVPVEPTIATRPKQPWPTTLTSQVRAIKDSLRAQPLQTPQQIASGFKPASRTRVAEILETLTALGQTRLATEDRYTL